MSNTKVERQIIWISAGTEARRRESRKRIERLMALADWPYLAELLRNGRLLPTLGPRILALGGSQATEKFATEVTGALEAVRRQDALLLLISTRVQDALDAAGIGSTVLKGPLLGEALYGEPGRRLSSDIDLLVAQERLYEAVEIVCELGYAHPADYVGKTGLPLLHFALAHKRSELPSVELHWRIHWYESRFARDRLMQPAGDEPTRDWRPAPIDELAALLLFYARDGFLGLRHAADIGAWWDVFGGAIQAGALDELIRTYPELGRALTVALRVAEKTVGLPIDQIVRQKAKRGIRDRIASRLADPYPHASEAQLYADMGLVDGLLSPPGDLWAFIRRQVAPPRAVIREGAHNGRVNSTLGHSVRVLGRYGLALASSLRPLETPTINAS